MAVFKKCKLQYLYLEENRPNKRYNKTNPTWEVQLITDDPDQRQEWIDGNLRVSLVVGKKGTENEGEAILNEYGKKQWRVNLHKKTLKIDPKTKQLVPALPVTVVDGNQDPIDPGTLANGCVGNVRVFQRDYVDEETKEERVANILMAIQITKHVIYKRKTYADSFDNEETEVIQPEGEPSNSDDDF